MSIDRLKRLSPPPRRLPLPVRCHQRFGGMNQMAWWFAAFITPFFWLFFMDCEVISWFRFARPLATCPGTVTSIEHTKSSEGEQTVVGNHYSFTLIGKQYSGCSYSTGTMLTKGSPVTVEYAASNPAVSRIVGYRAQKFGAGATLVLIFPLIISIFFVFGWRHANTSQYLLQHGIPGEAEYRDKEATQTSVKDETVYKIIFDFVATDGKKYEVTMRKCENEPFDRPGQVLYDPADPKRAMLIDDLPAEVRVDRDGNLHPTSSRRALLVTIVPLFTIAMNALWLWYWLFK